MRSAVVGRRFSVETVLRVGNDSTPGAHPVTDDPVPEAGAGAGPRLCLPAGLASCGELDAAPLARLQRWSRSNLQNGLPVTTRTSSISYREHNACSIASHPASGKQPAFRHLICRMPYAFPTNNLPFVLSVHRFVPLQTVGIKAGCRF
jgi:hypothetical protein